MEKAEIENLLMTPIKHRRLGKYVLLGRLGHGGMGKIYLASQPGPAGIEKLLVIKRLHSHLTADGVLVDQFLDEARLSMALNHPNIVHTYDVGESGGRYFMVMEYLEGQNLGVLLRTSRRAQRYPSAALAATMFLGVLDGLHAAHTARDSRGRALHIIHRDVSPQNIFLTYDGIAKVVDFGIAKAAMRLNETGSGILKGKYAYMSPEQCDGEPLDPRSDVFAAGIVLWESLTARRLFKSDSVLQTVNRIQNEAPVPPHELNPAVDPKLSAIVVRALQKKPEERYESAETFRDALEEYLHSIEVRPKRSDVRDLMRDVFSEVIERQRSLVDRALSAPAADFDKLPHTGDGALMTMEDRASTNPRILALPSKEGTTPSGLSRMPLASDGGDAATELEGGPSLPETEVLSRDASTEAMPTSLDGLPTSAELAEEDDDLLTPAAEAMAAPAVGAAQLRDLKPEPEAQAPARLPLVILALFIVVASGIGYWVYEQANAIPDDIEARLSDPPPEADTPAPEPDPFDLEGIRVMKSPEPTPEAPKPKPTGAKRPSANKSRPTARSGARGQLTLFTQPWAEVYLNGKKLGATPLVKVKLAAGTHTLRLKNPDAGIDQPYKVTIKAGELTKRKLKLD